MQIIKRGKVDTAGFRAWLIEDQGQCVAALYGDWPHQYKGQELAIVLIEERPIDILSEDDIPTEFKEQVVSWKIDKKAITEHVMATGEIPPGVETRQITTVRFN